MKGLLVLEVQILKDYILKDYIKGLLVLEVQRRIGKEPRSSGSPSLVNSILVIKFTCRCSYHHNYYV